jgi:hypothetical protein
LDITISNLNCSPFPQIMVISFSSILACLSMLNLVQGVIFLLWHPAWRN